MKNELIDLIHFGNPWLQASHHQIIDETLLFSRAQMSELLNPQWDPKCLTLVGPRQAGKTTLGKQICEQLIHGAQRFDNLLYINCDDQAYREWLSSPIFVKHALEFFMLKHPIIMIDEVQRLDTPGLLLKSIIDLKQPIKLIATGSSQLEFKSKIQEHLPGRQLETIILPLSLEEITYEDSQVIYGLYPEVATASAKIKPILIDELYRNVIEKDMINILRVSKPDVIEKLMTLVAASSGQLVNYQQLASDCNVSTPTIQHYLSILENTYILKKLTPFVGNRRKEVTSNPVYYFIDNGFRNRALHNFNALEHRQDKGLLVESFVFQTLLKFDLRTRTSPLNMHYWRTLSGAEIDFILAPVGHRPIPIEVKYRKMKQPSLTRAYHSFIRAYAPNIGFVITQDLFAKLTVHGCHITFLPLRDLNQLLSSLPTGAK